MSTNHIDTRISQEQIDKVLAAIKTIEEAMPQLIDLTAQQRQAMIRYSDKDLAFVLKTLALAEQHPEILPPSFDLDAMRRDVDVLQKLDGVLRTLGRLIGRFEDTCYAAGSESKGHSNLIYQFVKTHNTITGGLEDALAELAKHFARKSTKADKSQEA